MHAASLTAAAGAAARSSATASCARPARRARRRGRGGRARADRPDGLGAAGRRCVTAPPVGGRDRRPRRSCCCSPRPRSSMRLGSSDAGNDPTAPDHAQGLRPAGRGLRPGLQRAAAASPRSCRRPVEQAAQAPAVARRAAHARRTSPRSRRRAGQPDGQTARLTRLPAPRRRRTQATTRPRPPPARRRAPAGRARDRRDRATSAAPPPAQIDFSHVLWRASCRCSSASSSLLSALLLLIVFRSLVIPVQAALMNLLSIGASLGRRGGDLPVGLVRRPARRPARARSTPFIPVMMFAIVFGLSMDYEVFLVSRIHEEWTQAPRRIGAPWPRASPTPAG